MAKTFRMIIAAVPLLFSLLSEILVNVKVGGVLKNACFFSKGAQVGGQTWDLFDFSFIFSHNCSALDHSATAPPKH